MAVESQRIISHSNFLFFVLSLSPNQMRDRLPLMHASLEKTAISFICFGSVTIFCLNHSKLDTTAACFRYLLGADYMRVFSPGWNFSPPSRGEIGVRLYESFQPGLKLTTVSAPKSFEV